MRGRFSDALAPSTSTSPSYTSTAPQHGPEQSGLAGTTGAEQTNEVALHYLQVNLVEHPLFFVAAGGGR